MPQTQVVAAMNSRGEVAGQAAVDAGDENAAAREVIIRLGRKALQGTVITADAKHTSSSFIAVAGKVGAFWLLPVVFSRVFGHHRGNQFRHHQDRNEFGCHPLSEVNMPVIG